MDSKPKLVAIVGGSGSGKSWLAALLEEILDAKTARLSLDDFYLDRSKLTRSQRARINFDHPEAIDWSLFQNTLQGCRAGRAGVVPRYDFGTHTRADLGYSWRPQPLVLVDGLWLLHRSVVRAMFDLTVFLDCPTDVRFERRLARDVAERERTADSVRQQFWTTVAPMHDRFVAPQKRWAELVIRHPAGEKEISNLLGKIYSLT